ncbi:thiamine pyrophosphokinase [Pseudomassariella vexata]|uniref:Thiamine pyrophosphokinase n=1 Tax=Pseudomassariella vexata TaxID=1141098 RepID=A0A1Y2DKM1_9PEZI|nr:thiamine pyrophosphokinase [Pseudomassariella vexata]ORY59751.1 Thiamin pyrophosphokinase [Pseudomassariella vexata]
MSSNAPIVWHPALNLQAKSASPAPSHSGHGFALIILNQALKDLHTLKRLWWNASYRVAADGGANRLYDSNRRLHSTGERYVQGTDALDNLDVIIGDLDSLSDTARRYFTQASPELQIIHDPDQYSTDFGKAVQHIRNSHVGRSIDIVAMGGLGGRVDQGLSQLHHLYAFQTSPSYAEGRLFLVSGASLTFLLKAGSHRIHVRERDIGHADGGRREAEEVFGQYVGIIPVKEPSVISTKGLEWDVEDWPTEMGRQVSTSNHVLPETEVVEVKTTADVLFTISLKEKAEAEEKLPLSNTPLGR